LIDPGIPDQSLYGQPVDSISLFIVTVVAQFAEYKQQDQDHARYSQGKPQNVDD
jgi:hypothetical protein